MVNVLEWFKDGLGLETISQALMDLFGSISVYIGKIRHGCPLKLTGQQAEHKAEKLPRDPG